PSSADRTSPACGSASGGPTRRTRRSSPRTFSARSRSPRRMSRTSSTARRTPPRRSCWATASRSRMPLRSLLHHFTDDPGAATLARDGGRAFASASLRPYILAALADEDPARATLVVAGDDRQARDLAGDLRAWL